MTAPAPRRLFDRPNLAALLGAAVCCALGAPAHGDEVDFYRDVYPILKANCIACHNKTTTKASLNMETPEAMRKGGDSGAGVVPGNGAESLIYQAAAHQGDVEMPPKGNKSGAVDLTPAQLARLKSWIDQGAKSSVQQARQIVWQPLPPGVTPIYSVALTRDGRFAACGRANQLFVYDLATRRLAARPADAALGSARGAAAHRALVQALAFSPDGTRLASGSFREVKLWRKQPPALTTRPADPALGAVVSAPTEDGAALVCADKQGVLHVLDAATGAVRKTIATGAKEAVAFVSLAPDGNKAAVCTAGGALALWDLATGQRIAAKDGVTGVRALLWTRDGRSLVTAGDDKVVRVWSVPTGETAEIAAPRALKGAAGAVTALAAAADPNLIAAASADGKVRVWNVAEGKPVRELAVAGAVTLALSADGSRLATGRGDGVVQVWDFASGKPVVDLTADVATGERLADLGWTAATAALEAAFQQQEVARLEAENKALDDRLKKADETIAAVKKELAEKEKALAAAREAREAAQRAADGAAAKAPAGKPDPPLEKQQKDAQDKLAAANNAEAAAMSAVKAVEVHLKDAEAEAQNFKAARARNGDALAAAGAALGKAKDAQAKAVAESAAVKKAASKTAPPLAVRFSADAQTVAAAFGDGSVRVWAVATGAPLLAVAGSAATPSAALVTGADGTLVACRADGSAVRMGITSSWVLERTLGGDTASSAFADRVNALRFSPDGKRLAAGSGEPTRSGDVSLWDVASGSLVAEWKERHADAVLSLDFSPDGKRLASGGADKVARVTDVASGKVVNLFEGHTHHVLGVSFRADGRVLATAGADGVVTIWDMLSGERKKKVEGWTKEVTSIQFVGATNQAVTSSGDNLVRIVNDAGGVVRAMAQLPDFMQSAASSADGALVIAGGEDGVLRVWNGTNGQELATFGTEPGTK
jgi:WD40 repeat protein